MRFSVLSMGVSKLDDCFNFKALSSNRTVLCGEMSLWLYSEKVGFLGPSVESRRLRRKGEGVVADLETCLGTSLLRRCLYNS